MPQSNLTQMLVADQKIADAQLQQAISLQKATGGDLGQILVKLGFIDDETLATYRARVDGVEQVDLTGMVIPESLVSSVPREVIQKYRVLPIRKSANTLTLAMNDPENFEAIEEIQFLTGMKVHVVVAASDALNKAITLFFADLDSRRIRIAEQESMDRDATSSEPEVEMAFDRPGATRQSGLDLTEINDVVSLRALIMLLIRKQVITPLELSTVIQEVQASSPGMGNR
jgi:type IV pilus assembly protein PilB